MITIFKSDGTVRYSGDVLDESVEQRQISNECYVQLKFSTIEHIPFAERDYVIFFNKTYSIFRLGDVQETKYASDLFEYTLKLQSQRADTDNVNLQLFDNTTSPITPGYDPNTPYSKGDVVTYHTLYWEMIYPTQIVGQTPEEGIYWQLKSNVTHTVSDYDPSKSYTYGEEANYNYCIWKHIGDIDTVGVHPEEGEHWTQLTTAPMWDFSTVLTPRRYAQLFCDNMNRARPNENWTVGYTISDSPKQQAFSNVTVLVALGNTATLYDTEFWIDELSHGNYTINIGKKSVITSLTMKYGFAYGFTNIQRNNISAAKKVTRLVALGGEKNLLATYRSGSKRLMLPGKYYLDASNIDLKNPLEDTHTWDDIYPAMLHATKDYDATATYVSGDMVIYNNLSWTCLASSITGSYPVEGTNWQITEGTVTEFVNEFKLIDKNLTFNPLDPTLIMSDGTIPKIHFITGNLAGYEFPISDFNKTTKQITFKSIEDGNDSTLPTAGYTFGVGDQFNIVDFYMPQEYITKNELYLQAKAQEYLNQYSLDQVSYKCGVDEIWSTENAIEFQDGSIIHVIDTDFGIDLDYRVINCKRYINSPYKYELELDNTPYVPSNIQSIINSTVKSNTYIQYNNLDNQMSKIRTYKSAKEAIEMAFDPESGYFTEGIAPLFVKTAMALFGTNTQQYQLTGVGITTSPLTPSIVTWSSGTIVDNSQQDTDRTWNIPAGSFTADNNDTFYYCYIRCDVTAGSTVSQIIFSEKRYKINSDSNYYYFLLGSLGKYNETIGIRQFYTSIGFTFINGGNIITGKILSADGNTYVNLDTGDVHFGDANTYLDWNKANAKLEIKGMIVVSPSGTTSVLPCYRGVYNSSYHYYVGDTVIYTINGGTSTYQNKQSCTGIDPTNASYWTPVASQGTDGSYFEYRFAKNGSKTTAPSLVNTDTSPSGWTTYQPTLGALEYLWTIVAKKTALGALITNWSTPVRISGADGANGVDGAAGPAPVFRGVYSGTTIYYGNSIRVDVVKDSNGVYWVASRTAPNGTTGFSGQAPSSSSAYWNSFGASFDSIATNLLLAEWANLAGFIFQNNVMYSQDVNQSTGVANYKVNGANGRVDCGDIHITGGGIDIEIDGQHFLKMGVAAGSGVIQARADSATVAAFTTYGESASAVAMYLLSNSAGYGKALESYGNNELIARPGETSLVKGLRLNARSLGESASTSYQMLSSDDCIQNTSGKAITITMPDAYKYPGKIYIIFNWNGSIILNGGTFLLSDGTSVTTVNISDRKLRMLINDDYGRWIYQIIGD